MGFVCEIAVVVAGNRCALQLFEGPVVMRNATGTVARTLSACCVFPCPELAKPLCHPHWNLWGTCVIQIGLWRFLTACILTSSGHNCERSKSFWVQSYRGGLNDFRMPTNAKAVHVTCGHVGRGSSDTPSRGKCQSESISMVRFNIRGTES